jgi:hypothetical protein
MLNKTWLFGRQNEQLCSQTYMRRLLIDSPWYQQTNTITP